MSNTLEKHLREYGVFNEELPKLVTTLADCIPNPNIPYRMKVAIAITELVKYASQFKKHIELWNGSLVPINAITFCIGKSGVGKDSSVRAVQKCFSKSYESINSVRIAHAKAKAIEEATENGAANPDEWAVYKHYYQAPGPLEIGVSTTEGLLQYLSELSDEPVGAGFLYSGELGAELVANANLIDNIKALSELYDEGNKSMKALKDKTKQTEVKNVAVSALLMGSQDNILYDDNIKRRFKTEFTTKLGRRSFFVFVNEELVQEEVTDIFKAVEEDRKRESEANECRRLVTTFIDELTSELLPTQGEPIRTTSDTEMLFHLYKRYNEDESARISIQYPIAKLARAHMQWKALKLAGAFALMENSETIEVGHFVDAIRYTEMLACDVTNFERELVKEPYEVFTDYCHDIAVDGKASISLHMLRKLGYIPMKGNPTGKMAELVQLANSYDSTGTYSVGQDEVEFSELVKTDTVIISYKDSIGTKEERAKKCADGFMYEEIPFNRLQYALSEDLAFSNFMFKNGKRSTDNICSGTKWLIFDIDKSEITDEEAHILLSDINHFIVRSSDAENPMKFRVLIELDAVVDIPDIRWRLFISTVAEELGLGIDKLPKAQIFFSYKESASSILGITDASPLEVKPFLDKVQQLVANGSTPSAKALPKAKKNELLKDPMVTFRYAYETSPGEGGRSRCLIRVAKHAQDLGASKEDVVNLITSINDYWTSPLPQDKLDANIKQIERWDFTQ